MKKLLFLYLSITVILSSCLFQGERVSGNGNMKTEQRNVSGFNKVEAHGAIHLYVTQGELQPVRIEGDENLLQYIEVVEQGGSLEIKTRDNINLNPTKEIKVYVSAPEYKWIGVTGASNIFGQNKISGSELELHVSGAGQINMDIDVPEVKVDMSGAGEVMLKGETRRFELNTSGASKAMCYNLLSEETFVDISGAGEAQVYASQKLNVEVSGAGNISYKGEVKNITQEVSGAGNVRKAE